jgi:hypothetical protein
MSRPGPLTRAPAPDRLSPAARAVYDKWAELSGDEVANFLLWGRSGHRRQEGREGQARRGHRAGVTGTAAIAGAMLHFWAI